MYSCFTYTEFALMTKSTFHHSSELTGSVIDEDTVYRNKTYLKTLGVEQVSGLSIFKTHRRMYINILRDSLSNVFVFWKLICYVVMITNTSYLYCSTLYGVS